MNAWLPPEGAPPIPWSTVHQSLCHANRTSSPHKLSPWVPESPRRAAVAVVLWGDEAGARRLVLVQRGHSAPQHAGELAFPGGMVEPGDRDLPATARRELAEELGITDQLWELGCFPDGVAKARTRFTPVFFRWEAPRLQVHPGYEIHAALSLPLVALLQAPWTQEPLEHQGVSIQAWRLELPTVPLWGATAFILKAWLDALDSVR